MPRLGPCRVLGRVVVGCGVIAALAVAALPARAAAVVQPPVILAGGPLYDGLSAQWWKYVLSRPADTNPLADATGAHCRDGQSGPVFFLAGTINEGPAVRDRCVVPLGRALFFPLLDVVDVHTPGDDQTTPELIWADLQSLGFRADSLTASVDGVAVRHLDPARSPYYACSGPVAGCFPRSFSLVLPDANLFGLPAGTYEPAVDEGYYLLLAPLAPGRHTIAFGGSGTLGTQDITYHLRVAF